MFTNRNYTRHPVALRVWLNQGHWNEFVTADVSRRGLFVLMASPPFKEGQAVPIRVELPSKQVLEIFAQVKRVQTNQLQASGAGVGLEFFAVAANVKNAWDDFITSLRQKKSGPGFLENSQNLRDMLPPAHVRDMLKKMRDAGEIVQAPQLQRNPDEMRAAVIEVAPLDVEKLRVFADRVARAHTVFLKPKNRASLGQKVHVVINHPETDEEHVVYAMVTRIVTGEDDTFAGVQVRFDALSEREQKALSEFVNRALPDLGELPTIPFPS